MTAKQTKAAEFLLSRRLLHEPLAYILQETEFFGIKLYVDHRVLIPRPETESLCELALCELALKKTADTLIIDVGTGSGAIALALALNLAPPFSILTTDYSLAALAVAKRNIAYYKLDSLISCVCNDVLRGLKVVADLIISNAPYVADGEWNTLMSEVRDYEPREALVAGKDGLDVIRRLISQASSRLKPSGVLLLEISPTQQAEIAQLVAPLPDYAPPEFLQDLAGRSRFARIRKNRSAARPEKS